ncbi:MAG: hypothetical protein E3J92_02425 [Dehalococcoidia bacterium]|nr:MAG: hypothetical protein E3J92_02425 [Dehalococcoidia bacterium]
MRPLQSDLSIYKKFNFKHLPVAVKFSLSKPEGIKQLDKPIPFCEMLREAQRRGTPFYFGQENESCVGKVVLGMEEFSLAVEGGLIGPRFGIFQEPRANNKIYQYIPRFRPGLVNYVAFAPLDKLTFEPDLLVLTATPSQAETVLRAMSYSTGEVWETRTTGVLGCAWLYIYPFQSGKVNYTVTGLAFGTKAKEIFEEGWMLISIPYNWLPIITANLNEMEWVLPSYTDGREKFMKREEKIFNEAEKEAENA